MEGQTVAYAVALGRPNLKQQDRSYPEMLDRSLLFGVLVASVLSLLIGILLGNRLSRPLAELTRAIDNMKAGALRQQLPARSGDEIGQLFAAFNTMSLQLATAYEELEESHQTVSEQARQLRELSIRDELTGLFNRRHFNEQVHLFHDQALVNAQPLCLVMADIDHFKSINDSYGHGIGDVVLERVGDLIRSGIRRSDLAARIGGEEFVIVFPETVREDAETLCERLRQTIEAQNWNDFADGLSATISMGLHGGESPDHCEDRLKIADQRLYHAKESGRNRLVA